MPTLDSEILLQRSGVPKFFLSSTCSFDVQPGLRTWSGVTGDEVRVQERVTRW